MRPKPESGRDPLVKGALCTYRGLRWNAEARARIDGGSRGLHALAVVQVHASGSAATAVVGTLKPGAIYPQGDRDELPEGWRAVRLPCGRVGAVPEAQVRDPAASGLCFLRDAGGRGWRAVASALL